MRSGCPLGAPAAKSLPSGCVVRRQRTVSPCGPVSAPSVPRSRTVPLSHGMRGRPCIATTYRPVRARVNSAHDRRSRRRASPGSTGSCSSRRLDARSVRARLNPCRPPVSSSDRQSCAHSSPWRRLGESSSRSSSLLRRGLPPHSHACCRRQMPPGCARSEPCVRFLVMA